MRRRDFTAGLLFAAAPRSARAQQPEGKHRIAIIDPVTPADRISETGGYFYWRAFFADLRRLGDVEGKNLVIERYSAEGHPERYAELARQAVASRPDVIVAISNGIVLALQSATRTIPIVGVMVDPLKNGLVHSLARPGGNLTGVSADPGLGLYAKDLQLLKEAVPSASRVAVLVMRRFWKSPLAPSMRDAARQLGISLIEEPLAEGTPAAIARAFATILRARPNAIYVNAALEFYVHRRLVLDRIEQNHLPAIFQAPEFVAEGGLMSYGVDGPDLIRRLADITHKVLTGTKPGDIPIAQPTRFVFAINLKTARALGLTLSPLLLARADEVFQ